MNELNTQIDIVIEAQAPASHNLSQCLAAYYHPTPPTQLPVVRSKHVRTCFDTTQSQESKSEVCAQEFYVAMHIKTPLDNALYLSSLWSDLSM